MCQSFPVSLCSKFSQLYFCRILFELVYSWESYHKNKKGELFIETKYVFCHSGRYLIRNSHSASSIIQTTKRSAATEIARVGGHYAVQGHSMSLIMIPIDSPYVWFPLSRSPTYIVSRIVSNKLLQIICQIFAVDGGIPLLNTSFGANPQTQDYEIWRQETTSVYRIVRMYFDILNL